MNGKNADVIHVAQVIGITGCGGVESVVMNYYKNIDRSKVQFDFLVEDTSKIIDKEKIESMGGKVIIIPPYSNPFRYMKVLEKIFRREKYDIVHSNMNSLSVFTLRAAKKAGVKIRIAHSHSTADKREFKRTLIKNMLRPFSRRYATHFFACSDNVARWLFGNKLVEEGKVSIINNAIDIDKFKYDDAIREEVRNELNLDGKLVIGHIGRFAQVKNHDFIIDMFNELQKIKNDSMLVLVGDGPLHVKIVDKVAKLNLKEKVLFINTTSTPERFYQSMDCFVLPSLYEGFPVVGVEAQVNGLNCYFSDTITNDAKLSDNTIFLSINEGATLWAKQILSDFESHKISRNNFVANEHFDIKCQSKRLLSLYQHMLKTK